MSLGTEGLDTSMQKKLRGYLDEIFWGISPPLDWVLVLGWFLFMIGADAVVMI